MQALYTRRGENDEDECIDENKDPVVRLPWQFRGENDEAHRRERGWSQTWPTGSATWPSSSVLACRVEAIHGAAAHRRRWSALVDAVYVKLFGYDATKRHFARQHGYDGPMPASLEALTLDHPLIAFRKQHLGRYLAALVTSPTTARW